VGWLTEITGFPAGTNDDRVDAMSQLFIWWGERSRIGDHSAHESALGALADKLGLHLR
jgi:hypothetical protein